EQSLALLDGAAGGTQADRRFFQRHPSRVHYLRRAYGVTSPNPHHCWYVYVRQVAPGWRSRFGFLGPAGFTDLEMSDDQVSRWLAQTAVSDPTFVCDLWRVVGKAEALANEVRHDR